MSCVQTPEGAGVHMNIRICFLFTMYDNPQKHACFRETKLDEPAAVTAAACAQNSAGRSVSDQRVWWSQTGSNRRPHACKARALPTELWPRRRYAGGSEPGSPPERHPRMVGLGGFEPPTSRLSSARSNQLSYKPEPCSTPVFGIDPVTGLVREERETKTAASRSIGLTGRNIPSDPIGKPKLP